MSTPENRESVVEGARPSNAAQCHVLSAGYAAGNDEWHVECPSLDPQLLRRLRDASDPCHGLAAAAEPVLAVVRLNRLPGVAIIWNATPFPPPVQALVTSPDVYLPPPAAWTVPFEPVELDEADPTVRQICDFDPILQTRTGKSSRVGYLHPARWGISYLLVVLLVPLAMILSCCGLPSLFSREGPVTFLAIFLLVCVACALVRRIAAAGKWLLVPGGVVVRKEHMWSRKAELRLFTAAATLLVLTPEPPGWRATLFGRSRRVSRLLTRVEATALLRTWQSPCPSPPVDRLADMA